MPQIIEVIAIDWPNGRKAKATGPKPRITSERPSTPIPPKDGTLHIQPPLIGSREIIMQLKGGGVGEGDKASEPEGSTSSAAIHFVLGLLPD
jgi:hypothetical protein